MVGKIPVYNFYEDEEIGKGWACAHAIKIMDDALARGRQAMMKEVDGLVLCRECWASKDAGVEIMKVDGPPPRKPAPEYLNRAMKPDTVREPSPRKARKRVPVEWLARGSSDENIDIAGPNPSNI